MHYIDRPNFQVRKYSHSKKKMNCVDMKTGLDMKIKWKNLAYKDRKDKYKD
jgi:hypothetical protein